MLIYRFSIHSADGSDREVTGRMALRDDKAARAFGKDEFLLRMNAAEMVPEASRRFAN